MANNRKIKAVNRSRAFREGIHLLRRLACVLLLKSEDDPFAPLSAAMKKRSEARFSKSLLIDISRRGFQQMGVTVNISRRGMFIATTEAFRRRSRLRILIAAADQIYALDGTVVWKMKGAAVSGHEAPARMGIRIESAAPGYYRYIAAIRRSCAPVPPAPAC